MYGHVVKGVLCSDHKDGGLCVHLGRGGVLFCVVYMCVEESSSKCWVVLLVDASAC